MKQNHYFKRTLSALLLLLASTLSWADDFSADFSAKNADGITIYYNLINDGTEAEVTDNDGHSNSYSGDVNIPETVVYNGETLNVTSIGYYAFYRCSGLTSVTIPESVESIGNRAFRHCYNLTSITIPESVTSIGEEAFSVCRSLTSVNIPNSVTSIGGQAFYRCSGLTSVIIPESVESIDQNVFSACSNLTSITVDKNNPIYDSRDNCNAIIETAINALHTGCQSTVIPNSVTSIGDWAFNGCSGLTSVTIPNSVTSIGEGAFYECSGLTSITIPNSVTSIGEGAFLGCSSLTSVYSLIKNPFGIGSIVFYGIADDATLYVPRGKKYNKYKSTKGWTRYFSRVVEK